MIAGINDILPENAVEIPGKAVEALRGEGQDRLRRMENLPRRQLPGEALRLQAGNHAHASGLIRFNFLQMASGIHQHEAVGIPRAFRGCPVAEDDEGILLMAGHAAVRAQGQHAPGQRQALRDPLHAVAAVKVKHVILPVGKIHREGGRLFQRQRSAAGVGDPDGAGQDILGGENVIEELNRQPEGLVLQGHGQRFRVLRGADKGKAGNRLAPGGNQMAGIARIHAAASVFTEHPQGRRPIIAHAGGGVFLRQGVQGESAVHPLLIRIAGEAPAGQANEIGHVSPGFFAVIEMKQDAALGHLHLIKLMGCFQRKNTGFRVIGNAHGNCAPSEKR